ncbi:MAG: sensor histidine kinase [Piscirickettsiaceae bacterium]|nr:MAG: sensor histidine kinase [Piscirickettsiaceae bacterium]
MKSIRTYLLLALLATITLVSFLSVLQGYRASIDKVDELFDERLKSLAEIIVHANYDTVPRKERVLHAKPNVFFQIWSDNKTLLARSENAPTSLLFDLHKTDQLKADLSGKALSSMSRKLTPARMQEVEQHGYRDVNFNQFRWRTFVLRDKTLHRWVVTGERVDLRFGLADTIVSAAIRPTVLAIPIAAIIIWLAIGFGLRPLKQLTQQLSNKKADDLTPVVLKETPIELTQLITTTNDLLSRLNDAFSREKQFSADAAHELRTPISALNVQMYNLKQKKNLSENELRPLADGIKRMGHVVEQILSLYRNTPDQASSQQRDINLYTVAQQVIANEYSQFDIKNQEISLTGDQVVPIKGDLFALETLIQNLLINAAKYSPENGRIHISILQQANSVCLTVEDSGEGIPAEDYERVFERFYRVGGDQHASGEAGCGLGLAIVKHIVVMHGASIKLARSDLLGGLSVRVTFKGVNDDG